MLLLASVTTSAYGAWPADALLLLPAVIAVAARLALREDKPRIVAGLATFLALSLLTLAIERGPTTELYVWIPPLYFAAYLAFSRGQQKSPPDTTGGLSRSLPPPGG